MPNVTKVDFLYRRLHQDIGDWYDKHYYSPHKDMQKNIHLNEFESMYSRSLFSGTMEEIIKNKEIESFLTLVHERVYR